ncbi:MAG: hypothetical protein LC667_15265, partial [Thioalkalivibrio sp.]|nr:hypothetical protein [Thioalkalivibrio sp.]
SGVRQLAAALWLATTPDDEKGATENTERRGKEFECPSFSVMSVPFRGCIFALNFPCSAGWRKLRHFSRHWHD